MLQITLKKIAKQLSSYQEFCNIFISCPSLGLLCKYATSAITVFEHHDKKLNIVIFLSLRCYYNSLSLLIGKTLLPTDKRYFQLEQRENKIRFFFSIQIDIFIIRIIYCYLFFEPCHMYVVYTYIHLQLVLPFCNKCFSDKSVID